MVTYSGLIILSNNRQAFKLSISNFVFWIKIFFYAQGLAAFWWRYTLIYGGKLTAFEVLDDILLAMAMTSCVVIFGSLDGLQMSRRMKIGFGIMISTACSIVTIYNSLWVDESAYEESLVEITKDIQFSLISLEISSMRVVMIFFWKQTLLTILKRNECVNIKHAPCMKWVS